MWISVVAAGEFEVRQPVTDLPLQNFRILPYNLPHAVRAAKYFREAREVRADAVDSRPIIVNDLKIIAQAAEDNIPTILTEDASTLSRLAKRLRDKQVARVEVVLLSDGFAPGRLNNPSQTELPLPPS